MKKLKSGKLFENLPRKSADEVFDVLAAKGEVKIERIVSHGHASPLNGWFDQPRDEWVIVLKGAAILEFEHSEDISLEPGGYVILPARTAHRVKWTAPNEDTVWLAVHYPA